MTFARRREFPAPIYAQIVKRAMNERGLPVCEGCGLVLGKKPYEIDHTIPEALLADKRRPLTAADGKLLGKACCHAPKTAADLGQIAKAKRQERGHLRIPRSGLPMPGSRKSQWKHTMGRGWERRT